jgi:MOSC domain-containing protein YiiM
VKLLSVNVGEERAIQGGKPSDRTGIFKLPRAGPVKIVALGLEGDAIVDKENHGGPDQAVYVYTKPDYDWWSVHIGRPLGPGMFGENLTLSDLESASLLIGDRLRVGVTIAARMKDPQFVKKLCNAEKPGAYCRVLETGAVQAGDTVEHIPYPGVHVSLLESFRAFYRNGLTEADLRRFLRVPLHSKDRRYYEELLKQIER